MHLFLKKRFMNEYSDISRNIIRKEHVRHLSLNMSPNIYIITRQIFKIPPKIINKFNQLISFKYYIYNLK